MNLLIQASLTEPPSDSLAFRYITLVSKQNFNMDILLLTEQQMKDKYYFYMKKRGLFDYIDYILTKEEKNQENGLRLDNNINNPPVITLKAIVFENQISIINSIRKFI